MALRFPVLHDQDTFMKISPRVDNYTRDEVGLRIKYLNPKYFAGLCQYGPYLKDIVTLHINCCFGFDNKLRLLQNVSAEWDKRKLLKPVEAADVVSLVIPRC